MGERNNEIDQEQGGKTEWMGSEETEIEREGEASEGLEDSKSEIDQSKGGKEGWMGGGNVKGRETDEAGKRRWIRGRQADK